MRKVISSTNNKITFNGSRKIHFLKAVGLDEMNFINTDVKFIITVFYCDGGSKIIGQIPFLDMIDEERTMLKNSSILDFSADAANRSNTNLKTEFEFHIPENKQFELFYEIESFSTILYPMRLNRELDHLICIKNSKENKGLTWHMNLLSIQDSKDALNELNNMHLFRGRYNEALKLYNLLAQNNFTGEFNTTEANEYQNYKYVYIYSKAS